MKLVAIPPKIIERLEEQIYSDNLTNIYDYFCDNYEESWDKSDQGFQKLSTAKLADVYRKEIRDIDCLIGIDLPTIFESDIASGKIIVLAQDPLRSTKDFCHEGKVIIGTPYALHSRYYRNKSSKLYFQIINGLSHNYRNIYLTDVLKVYAEGSNLTSNKILLEVAYKLLYKEIKELKPDKILAMGSLASKALTEKEISAFCKDKNIEIVNTPHPRARHEIWLEAGANGSTDTEKVKHIIKKVIGV